MNVQPTRSTAEWVSLLASAGLLLVVVGLIVMQIPGDGDPAAPVARIVDVRSNGDAFHVDVLVENAGGRAAGNVQVSAELTIGSDVQTGDQVIDFLSADEETELTFVFADDPATGDLVAAVTSYATP